MGFVNVQTDDGVIRFQIEGDTPNALEQSKMQRIIMKQAPERKQTAQRKKDEQMFDYKTGIQDTKLRRMLSRADTADDEKKVLESFGILENQFTRDRRGRLALSPEAAKKFGVRTDKNVIIDERGMSRADFADLSSLGRELAGGIGGALVGQTVIPIPLLGAVIGAATGTGGAKLIEEGQEALQGVQTETLGEVGKAAGKEALIAGAGEGIFGGIGKLFGRVVKGKPGKDLTPEQMQVAGESLEEGITPTLSQIGASPILARQQAMSEKVMKTSKRLRDNHANILKKLDGFKNQYGTATAEEAADALTAAARAGNKSAERQQKEFTKLLVQNLKEANEQLGASTVKDEAIDDDLYKIVRDSYKLFDNQMQKEFESITKLVDDASGQIPAFNMRAIKADAQTELDNLVSITKGKGNLGTRKQMLDEITALPDDASFAQIYNARKQLNDTWLSNVGSSNVKNIKDKFLGQLDDKLEMKEIGRALKRVSLEGLSREQRALYRSASKQLVPARAAYKEGIEQYENLSGAIGLRTLVNDVKGGKKPDVSGAATAIIKNNKPKILQNAKAAVEKQGKDWNPIRDRLAGEWMRTAFKESVKQNKSGGFSANIFKDKLDKLGKTADELFAGKDLAQIKKLTEQMSAINLAKLSDDMIDDVLARGADESAINLLRNLKTIADEKAVIDRSRAFRQLQDGSITAESAAEVIASGATKDSDVAMLMKNFTNPDDMRVIQSYYMDNIIGDFGGSFLTDPKQFKLFGERLQKEFKTGKLTTVFGDEMAKDMNKFGRIMVFNSKAAEGGDLVAANIAASPLENIGKIARLGLFGRVLSSAPQYKSITKQYELMTKGASPKRKAEVFGQLLAQAFSSAMSQAPLQVMQEGAQEASKQVSAMLSNVQQPKKPAVTPSQTPVPQVRPAVQPEQVSAPAPAPAKPLGMQGIRERAKGDPAVAMALLGGLGNASLL